MDYHRNQNNSNRNTAPFTTERQPENDINLLLHFDLLSIREPPPDSQYFDFGSTSNSPLPSEKPASHPSQPSIKCQYCNEPFPQNDINHHQEDCYKRKIFCATCAEMIPLEIFDYHSNTCLYNHDNIAFQYQNHYSHDHHDNHDFHSLEDDTPPEENHHQDFWHPGHDNDVHNSEEDSNQNPDFHYPDDEEKEDEKDGENDEHMFAGYSNMYSYHPVSGTYAQGSNIPFDVAYGYGIAGEDLPERYHDPHPYHEDSESDSGEGGEPIYEQDLRTYEQMMALDNNVVKKGISEEEIKKFPIELYLTEVDGDARCTVCITDYESGETLRRLSCTHRFHRDCIDKWLDHNITCPICKKYLR